MNTKTTTYWQSNNGSVCCEKHIGYSASSELATNPKAKTLYTGPDTWYRMTKNDIAEWATFLSQYDTTEMCEECRGGF